MNKMSNLKTKSLEILTSDERNLLLYLETRAVDHGGKVDAQHMNKEDFDIVQKWNKEGFVKFGRIRFHSIIGRSVHWCELSEEAWDLAHAERRAKYFRIIKWQKIDKTRGGN